MSSRTHALLHWRTPHSTRKDIKVTRKIVSGNAKVAEVMNNHFVDITKELVVSPLTIFDNTSKMDLIFIDPIDQIVSDYSEHPNVLMITKRIQQIFLLALIQNEIMAFQFWK